MVIYVNSNLQKLHNVKVKMTHHLTVNSMKVFNWAFPMQVEHFTRHVHYIHNTCRQKNSQETKLKFWI